MDFCFCPKIPVAGRFLPGILEVNATWIRGRFFELVMDGCFLVGSAQWSRPLIQFLAMGDFEKLEGTFQKSRCLDYTKKRLFLLHFCLKAWSFNMRVSHGNG